MKKTLIVYATKTGTTQDAAELIAARLEAPCDLYDCTTHQLQGEWEDNPVLAPKNLPWEEYDTVLLGTAMYMGFPRRAFRKFCKSCTARLLTKKIALFTCGIATEAEDKRSLYARLPQALTAHALFYRHLGGEARPERLGVFGRAVMEKFSSEHADRLGIKVAVIDEIASLLNPPPREE